CRSVSARLLVRRGDDRGVRMKILAPFLELDRDQLATLFGIGSGEECLGYFLERGNSLPIAWMDAVGTRVLIERNVQCIVDLLALVERPCVRSFVHVAPEVLLLLERKLAEGD